MYEEIKTLDGWCEFSDHTGKESIYDYLRKGDIVSEDIVDNFMNMLPPRAMSHGYLQVGEAYDHVYDLDGRLKAIYMTFAKCDGQWRYYGNCFVRETIDKSGDSRKALFFYSKRKDDVIMCLKNNQYANGECSLCKNCSEFLNTCRPIIINEYLFGECDLHYCEFCERYEECMNQEGSY